MQRRFVSIWFRHLKTDWFAISQPELNQLPFVLRAPSHGRMMITATNAIAESMGIERGMVLADARAIIPTLQVLDDKPDLIERLLPRLGEWCIRFTPTVALDPPDGLLLEVTGCTHLWGGDSNYLQDVVRRLSNRGYDVRAAMTDTMTSAWGIVRYGREPLIIPEGQHVNAILTLPPEALRLEPETIERLHKLGLQQIGQFISMPRSTLRRRFGQHIIQQLDFATGKQYPEMLPVHVMEPYHERLPCLEPILTAPGIEIALQQLLLAICLRLKQESKGLRMAVFKAYRMDGKIERVEIGTTRPSHSVKHLLKLFELKLPTIEPALGIELFTLEASKVEEHLPFQEKLWEGAGGLEDDRLAELVDRLAGRVGINAVHRYLPDEHYWPERSFKMATSLLEKSATAWMIDRPRPTQLLAVPRLIEVTAPIPDYPPMLFRYEGKVHKITRADGPERIEQEWWLQRGQHRDYYSVEDEEGKRYWIFRLGHYDEERTYQWFMHGFFA